MSQSVRDKGRDGTLGGVRTKLQTAARAAMVQAHEAAQVLSVAATAPARVIRSEYGSANAAPQAASRTVTARPVLLVHGFGGAKSSWALVAEKLSAHALFVETMSYPPLDTSVEKLADRLVGEVHSVLSRTGADKMHLVGHTLGGVIIAQALFGPPAEGPRRHGDHLGLPVRRLAVGCCVAGQRAGAGAAAGVATVAPACLCALARRRAVVVGDSSARRDSARRALGAVECRGADRHGRWRGTSWDATEPASDRTHNRRAVCTRARAATRVLASAS